MTDPASTTDTNAPETQKPPGDQKPQSPAGRSSSIGVGIALGVAFGVVFDNLAIGIALGVALGAAFSRRK